MKLIEYLPETWNISIYKTSSVELVNLQGHWILKYTSPFVRFQTSRIRNSYIDLVITQNATHGSDKSKLTPDSADAAWDTVGDPCRLRAQRPRLHDDDDDDDELVVALHGEWRLHRQFCCWSTASNLYMKFSSFQYRNILENVLITPEEVVEECLSVSLRNCMSHKQTAIRLWWWSGLRSGFRNC